jgi:hypothetical protein
MELKMTRVAEDITEIKTDVKWLCQYQKEHRAEHSRMRMMIYTALVGMCISLMVSYVTVRVKNDRPKPIEAISVYDEEVVAILE